MSAYDLERYLNVRSAYGGTLGPDGELAFLLNTTGVPQVWTLSEPGAWPVQRTFYDEPVSFAAYSPTRPELIFGMDEGGNERMQLFRLDPNGTVHPLTEDPSAKHRWGGWSHDGDRFAFASNRRDETVFDVYVQGRDDRGPAAECVYQGDGWLSLGGWSPSDDRLLVVQSHSSFDQDLFVLDLETGELDLLTPDTDDVRFHSASWGPAGERLYCVSDLAADTLFLASLDAETGDVTTVRDGGEWSIDGVAVDDETGHAVYSRNVDGYTELSVGELAGDSFTDWARPALPGAVAGGVSFGPDGERFALSASGRTVNTNVFLVDVQELAAAAGEADDPLPGAATQWTRAPTAGIPQESFRAPDLVHVESFDGLDVPALFTLPAEAPAGETPVIVDIHGGPESQRRPSFSGLRQYFLANGYALFEPNVRGSTGYGREYTHLDDVENRMDAVADLKSCADWLREQEAIDPDRIVAKGGSYGGFMVLAALTEYPDLWAAGVDSVGIANFVTFLENTGSWRRELREAEYGSLDGDRDLLEELSPINSAEAIEAPLFVLHGENDPRVPVGEAEQIAETVRENDVPVELLVFEDEGHGISKLDNRIEAYSRVVAFLDEHV